MLGRNETWISPFTIVILYLQEVLALVENSGRPGQRQNSSSSACEFGRLGADSAGINLFSSSMICHVQNESSWASSGRGNSEQVQIASPRSTHQYAPEYPVLQKENMECEAELRAADRAKETGTARCLHPPILVLGWGPPDPDLVDLLQIQREAQRTGQARRAQVPKGQCSKQDLFASNLISALPLAGHGGG
jgi:hypothetical protein